MSDTRGEARIYEPVLGYAVATASRHERINMAHAETPSGGEVVSQSAAFRRIRMDADLWERLDQAVKLADPDSNRSVVLRKFARWYVGDIDDMPQRPSPHHPQDCGGPQ